jgi:hypothetical protein
MIIRLNHIKIVSVFKMGIRGNKTPRLLASNVIDLIGSHFSLDKPSKKMYDVYLNV